MNNSDELYAFVHTIRDKEIREFTSNILKVLPKNFWTAKASKNHHPVDERGFEGNIIHSLRVAKICYFLGDALKFDSIHMDMEKSAGILHDGGRYKIDGSADYTVPEHPCIIREIANIHNISCIYDQEIFSIIEAHMGRWNEPPITEMNIYQQVLYLADVVSAKAGEIWKIESAQAQSTGTQSSNSAPPSVKSSANIWSIDLPFIELGMTEAMIHKMEELATDSSYWAASLNFAQKSASRTFSSLSPKQQSWAEKIISGLKEIIEDE